MQIRIEGVATEGTIPALPSSRKDKQNLEYDKITRAFKYSSLNFDINAIRREKPSFIDIQALDQAVNLAFVSFIKTSQFSNDFQRTYLTFDGSEFSKTSVAENADFIRQDIFLSKEIVSVQEDLEAGSQAKPVKGKIYFENPDEGHSHAIIVNKKYNERDREFDPANIREIENKDIEFSDTKGIYRLKTVESAWEEVSDGKGSLRKLVPQGENKIGSYSPLNVVRFTANVDQTELGFFATYEHSPYIYPIYIFKGTAQLKDGRTADFVFYVPAIVE